MSGINEQLRAQIAEQTAKRETRESGEGWLINGSSFKDYEAYFSMALGPHNLREYLSKIPSPTVIDLMASPDTIADLFKTVPGRNKLGISMSTLNHSVEESRDEDTKIHHIVGDLLTEAPWRELDKVLDGRKADLIMERAMSGLIYLPQNIDFFNLALFNIWKRTNPEGGAILLQTPTAFQFAEMGINLYSWLGEVRKTGTVVEYAGMQEANSGRLLIERSSRMLTLPALRPIK